MKFIGKDSLNEMNIICKVTIKPVAIKQIEEYHPYQETTFNLNMCSHGSGECYRMKICETRVKQKLELETWSSLETSCTSSFGLKSKFPLMYIYITYVNFITKRAIFMEFHEFEGTLKWY